MPSTFRPAAALTSHRAPAQGAPAGSSHLRRRARLLVPASLGLLTSFFYYSFYSGQELHADDSDFFSHNYAAVGIMQEGATQMTPSVDVESRTFDQPRPAPPAAAAPIGGAGADGCDGRCAPGRFANRQTGVEGRVIPHKFGEKPRLDY